MNSPNGEFKNGQVPCPRSVEGGDPFADGWKIHYTTPLQIRRHGMCKACRDELKNRRGAKAILAGKAVETPAPMTWKRQSADLEHDHAGFDSAPSEELHLPTATTDFDFHAVERELGEFTNESTDSKKIAAEFFHRIMSWTFKPPCNLRIAAARWATVAAGLRPDIVNNRTWEDIGRELKRTKADISKYARAFQRAFGIKFQRSRSEAACAKMRARRLGGPDRRQRKARRGNV